MDRFLNAIKAQSAQLDEGWAQPRLATVTSVDPVSYSARVTVQPEGILSGWLPIASLWIGRGWGLACPPSPGDQVIVLSQEGDAQQGIVLACLGSQTSSAPPAPAGEFWLIHASGSFLKLHNDGSLESNAATWTHHGSLYATGDISDGHGTVASLRGHYNTHVHPPSTVTPVPTD